MKLAQVMKQVYEAVYNAPFHPDWLIRQRPTERKVRHIVRYVLYHELRASQMQISAAERELAQRLSEHGRQATTSKSLNTVSERYMQDEMLERVTQIVRNGLQRKLPFKSVALALTEKRVASLAVAMAMLIEQERLSMKDLDELLETADQYRVQDLL